MRRILAVLLLCLLGGARGAQAAPSLASLDIKPSDVPRAVVLVKTWVLTPALADYINVQAPGTSAKQGIVAGHAEFYECSPPAVCLLSTEIYLFTTKAAAHAWYVVAVAGDPPSRTPPGQLVTLPHFGNERFGQSVMGPKFPLSALLFRSGRYAVRVEVQSPTKILPVSRMIHLAGIIDSHIRHAP